MSNTPLKAQAVVGWLALGRGVNEILQSARRVLDFTDPSPGDELAASDAPRRRGKANGKSEESGQRRGVLHSFSEFRVRFSFSRGVHPSSRAHPPRRAPRRGPPPGFSFTGPSSPRAAPIPEPHHPPATSSRRATPRRKRKNKSGKSEEWRHRAPPLDETRDPGSIAVSSTP